MPKSAWKGRTPSSGTHRPQTTGRDPVSTHPEGQRRVWLALLLAWLAVDLEEWIAGAADTYWTGLCERAALPAGSWQQQRVAGLGSSTPRGVVAAGLVGVPMQKR